MLRAYSFENFMSELTAVAERCTAWSPMLLVGAKVLNNYQLALNVMIRKRTGFR